MPTFKYISKKKHRKLFKIQMIPKLKNFSFLFLGHFKVVYFKLTVFVGNDPNLRNKFKLKSGTRL